MNSFILSLLLLVASAWCIEYEVELGRASIKLDQEKMQLPTYPTHSNTFQLTTQSTIPLSALSYYMKYYNTLNLESFRNMIGGICLSHVSWFVLGTSNIPDYATFKFDLQVVNLTDLIVFDARLRLSKNLKPASAQFASGVDYTVKLYKVNTFSSNGLALLSSKKLKISDGEWLEFNVTDTAHSWAKNPKSNNGFAISVEDASGNKLSPNDFGLDTPGNALSVNQPLFVMHMYKMIDPYIVGLRIPAPAACKSCLAAVGPVQNCWVEDTIPFLSAVHQTLTYP